MEAFVSYSREDTAFVEKFEKALADIGVEARYDKNLLKPGDRWAIVLEDALRSADIVFFVLSNASLVSSGVATEMSNALGVSQRIVPVLIEDAPVPSYLGAYQWADFRTSFAEGFAAIEQAIEAMKVDSRADVPALESETPDPPIERLRRAFARRELTLFCGAGVSVASGLPDWGRLLRDLLAKMFESADPIANEHPVDAADLAGLFGETVDASPLIVGQYLKTAFGDRLIPRLRDALYAGGDPAPNPLIEAIAGLCRPRRDGVVLKSIVTFNFDDMIERVLTKHNVAHSPIYDEGQRTEPNSLPVYHVHGYVPHGGDLSDDQELVFTEDAYHTQFSEPFGWSNLVQLNELTQSTCLLVGLSVTDPNLRRLLDIAMRKYRGVHHYVVWKRRHGSSVMGDGVDNTSRTSRLLRDRVAALEEQDAQRLGLRVLWIDDYAELPNLIASVAETQ